MSTGNLHGADRNRLPLNDQELADAFQRGEVDGQEVMKRLLGKIGLADRAQDTLRRRDGSVLTGRDGRALLAIDYLAAAQGHPGAIPTILNFVRMNEQDPKFPIAREAISTIVNGYLPPKTTN